MHCCSVLRPVKSCLICVFFFQDRNVYTDNLAQFKAYDGSKGTYDLPGLKEMTLKAVDILKTRSDKNGDTG